MKNKTVIEKSPPQIKLEQLEEQYQKQRQLNHDLRDRGSKAYQKFISKSPNKKFTFQMM